MVILPNHSCKAGSGQAICTIENRQKFEQVKYASWYLATTSCTFFYNSNSLNSRHGIPLQFTAIASIYFLPWESMRFPGAVWI
jgi:hypothetical protein